MKKIIRLVFIFLIFPNIAFAGSLIDSGATTETVNTYNNLLSVSGNHIYFGMEDMYIKGTDGSFASSWVPTVDAFTISKKYPAVLGISTESLTPNLIQQIKTHYRNNGIIVWFWTVRNPVTQVFRGDPSYLSGDPITESITGGGSVAAYHTLLDNISSQLSNLTDDNGNKIPVILRLFPEIDGSWFWWGTNSGGTKAEQIQLFQETVVYLRDIKGIHNIIYCFGYDKTGSQNSIHFLDQYPGDDYCDIISVDLYYSTNTTAGFSTRLGVITDEASNRNKVSALTEGSCFFDTGSDTGADGPRTQPYWTTQYMDPILNNSKNKRISFAMCWVNSGTSYIYGPNPNDIDDSNSFLDMSQDDRILFINVPNLSLSDVTLSGVNLD